jgi:hypothetical protein
VAVAGAVLHHDPHTHTERAEAAPAMTTVIASSTGTSMRAFGAGVSIAWTRALGQATAVLSSS